MTTLLDIIAAIPQKPFYIDGDKADPNGVIYCANCLDILPCIPEQNIDLVLTDPPYGTGWIRGGGKKAGSFNYKKEIADWDKWNIQWMKTMKHYNVGKSWITFCPYKKIEEVAITMTEWDYPYLPVPSICIAWWRKTNPAPHGVDRESIILSRPLKYKTWEFVGYNGDCNLHPCQKPIELLSWLISGFEISIDIVLDPHFGVGSTGVAAKQLSRKFIGIEISEKYCEIAKQRLQGTPESLFKKEAT